VIACNKIAQTNSCVWACVRITVPTRDLRLKEVVAVREQALFAQKSLFCVQSYVLCGLCIDRRDRISCATVCPGALEDGTECCDVRTYMYTSNTYTKYTK